MKTTTRTLLTLTSLIAVLFASASVIAQPGPGNGAGTAAGQWQGRATERFQAADTDKDGALSKEEMTKGMPRMAERFAALDTNQDGKISSEEFQGMRQNMRGAGSPQGSGPQGMMQGRQNARSGTQKAAFRGKGGLINADTDKDGVVTRAEAEKYAGSRMLSHFDALDTDKDGKLSATELAQRQGQGPRR